MALEAFNLIGVYKVLYKNLPLGLECVRICSG
jgi:hypothetical protein